MDVLRFCLITFTEVFEVHLFGLHNVHRFTRRPEREVKRVGPPDVSESQLDDPPFSLQKRRGAKREKNNKKSLPGGLALRCVLVFL